MKNKAHRVTACLLAAWVVSSVSSVTPRIAHAQEDAVTLQARARFKEGLDAYDRGQYESARLAFLQAYALKKHPSVLLNLAQSSAKSNHALEALRYFQQFLRESTTAKPQQRTDAEAGLAELRQKLGRIEVIAPAGADLTLDEKEHIGTAPFAEPFDVEPGAHQVRSATTNETVRVTVGAGQRVQARMGMSAIATPPASGTGRADFSANASATDSSANRANEPGLFSPPANMTPVVVGLMVAGVGLVGTVTFSLFKADAQSKSDSVASLIRDAAAKRGIEAQGVCNVTDATTQKDFANACSTLTRNNEKIDTNATIANVSAVVMAAGAITAAGFYLFGAKRHEGPKTSAKTWALSPYAGFATGGVTLGGAF